MPSQNIRSKCHITDQNTVCQFVTCTGRSIYFRFGGFNCCLLPCWPSLWLAKGWILPSAAFQKELKEPSPSQAAAMEAEASDRFGICPAWVQDLPSYWLHLKVVFYFNWVFVLIESYLGSFHWLRHIKVIKSLICTSTWLSRYGLLNFLRTFGCSSSSENAETGCVFCLTVFSFACLLFPENTNVHVTYMASSFVVI